MTNQNGFYQTTWQKKLSEAFQKLEKFSERQDKYLLLFKRNRRNSTMDWERALKISSDQSKVNKWKQTFETKNYFRFEQEFFQDVFSVNYDDLF